MSPINLTGRHSNDMNNELYHFNKNHDKLGRFTFSRGGASSLLTSKRKDPWHVEQDKKRKQKQEEFINKWAISENPRPRRSDPNSNFRNAELIGRVAVGSALIGVGAYKLAQSGALDRLISRGKIVTVRQIQSGSNQKLYKNIKDEVSEHRSALKKTFLDGKMSRSDYIRQIRATAKEESDLLNDYLRKQNRLY